jgi:hypothetical protein
MVGRPPASRLPPGPFGRRPYLVLARLTILDLRPLVEPEGYRVVANTRAHAGEGITRPLPGAGSRGAVTDAEQPPSGSPHMTSIAKGAAVGATTGLVGAAAMAAASTLEQHVTGRPDSYVPAHTLARALGLRNPDRDSWARNMAMHHLAGATAGVVRGVMSAAKSPWAVGLVDARQPPSQLRPDNRERNRSRRATVDLATRRAPDRSLPQSALRLGHRRPQRRPRHTGEFELGASSASRCTAQRIRVALTLPSPLTASGGHEPGRPCRPAVGSGSCHAASPLGHRPWGPDDDVLATGKVQERPARR